MSIGAGLRLAFMSRQKPTKKCERCGLLYPEDEEICSHCGELNGLELQMFLERIAEERQSTVNLGKLFFYIAMLLIAGMFILNA